MLRCRVRATEAVGVIAASVGMEVLGPSLHDFVAAALQVGKALAIHRQHPVLVLVMSVIALTDIQPALGIVSGQA